MKKKVGLLLAIIMVMSLFTACKQTDGLDAAGNPTGSEVHSDSEWPRSYVDALGNEVTLEEPPQRVVSTFHAMYHDYMLALDVYPVGVAAADTFLTKWDAFDAYLNGHEVADVGATTAINLEMLLELEPDLIIGLTSQEDQYEAFSKIAPTILLDNEAINLDWKYGLEEFGKIFGKEDAVKNVILETETAVTDAADKLTDFRSRGESVIFVAMSGKTIWPYMVEQLETVYSEDGLNLLPPKGYEQWTDRSASMSLEALAEYNPDHIFLMINHGDDEAQAYMEELKSSSVWSAVSAVENGHVYFTDRSIFAFNAPISTQYGADFVAEQLSSASSTAAAWPRTITDSLGHEILLEKEPERISLMHIFWMEHFLMLDAPPAASAIGNALGQTETIASSEMYAPYLDGLEIADLGSARDINLEAIVSSEPDLIVTHALMGLDEVYEQLVEIAPVVVLDYAASWQDQLLACAEIVGKETKAQEVIAQVEPAISSAAELAAQHPERTFALFRTDGKMFISQGAAAYYSAFGLTKPDGFSEVSGEALSLEAVAEMDPYYIVFQHNYDAAVNFAESMSDSSVWQSLDAVKNGRVYYFDENMNTFGPRAMQLAAEKITELYSEST